ncbi:MAG: LysE family translocator [Desulfarculus sp.]|nr:MAG: LysE family translocator [Desulfarculus sp.]
MEAAAVMVLVEAINLHMQGLLVGVLISAPLGPVGVLCLRRSLQWGFLAGFVSGLGAAVADVFYGAVAVLGLASVSAFLLAHQFWVQLIGGVLVCLLGLKSLLARPREAGPTGRVGWLARWSSTFLLTLANPLLPVAYAAVYAAMGLGGLVGDYRAAGTLLLGVFVGAAAWWSFLAVLGALFSARLTSRHLVWINRAAGVLLLAVGLALLISLAL